MPPTSAQNVQSYIAAVVTLLFILIAVACFFAFAWTPWCGGAGSCGGGGLHQSCGVAPESDDFANVNQTDFLVQRRRLNQLYQAGSAWSNVRNAFTGTYGL